MELQKRWDRVLDFPALLDALAARDRDLEEQFNIAINASNAAIAVPKVAIDSAHAQYNFAAASAAGILTGLALEGFSTTTAASYSGAVNYIGRGVLTMAMLGEFTAAGIGAASGGLRITLDDVQIFVNNAYINRQSCIRVCVGSLNVYSTTLLGVVESVGLPFNSSCLIEFQSDGTRTATCAWKILKKL